MSMKYKNSLEQLKASTVIVADTGDIDEIERLRPEDATTNPSLMLKSAFQPQYQDIVKKAYALTKKSLAKKDSDLQGNFLHRWSDAIAVGFGVEILKLIPGRISTEVDARLSFDCQSTVLRARQIMNLYAQAGIGRERVLIKIAATWEGIQAAKVLEQEGIQCNLTLLFSLEQAIAAAEARVFLISPFVGRILDWYKKNDPDRANAGHFMGEGDPGVQSVWSIYQYLKYFDYPTIVMGASFRAKSQVENLAGCDRLTISPAILDELENSQNHLALKLSKDRLPEHLDRIDMNEKKFRWALNDNAMASDKLAEGIRCFAADQAEFEKRLQSISY